jgi:hypothetical protein
MSGGYFEYQQYRLGQMADEIKDAIYKNAGNDPDEYYNNYSKRICNEIFLST